MNCLVSFSSSNNKSTLASLFEVQIMYMSQAYLQKTLVFLNLKKMWGFNT